MTIKKSIHALSASLEKIYPKEEAKQIAIMAIGHLTGLQKSKLILKEHQALSLQESETLQAYAKRLLKHEPIQYVLEECFFYDALFYVNKNCLIPRAETEELVQLILQRHPIDSKTVLDIGTGSGCIALSLKSQRPTWSISALDISKPALEVAKKNAKDLKLDCLFIHENILSPQNTYTPFDIIVSNPPYVAEYEKKDMQKHVLNYEPKEALFSAPDPLKYYKAIFKFSNQYLTKNGHLYFEINPLYKKELTEIAEKENYTLDYTHIDFNHKKRHLCFVKR